MARRFAAILGTLTAVAFLCLTATGGSAGDLTPQDLTFAGPMEVDGSISVTLTADRTGLTRASVHDIDFTPLPGGQDISRNLYYDPPAPIADGAFEVWLPLQLFGMARASVHLTGEAISETEIEGLANITACVFPSPCQELPPHVAWHIEGPVETPPGPGEVLFEGSMSGDGGGSITLAFDPSLTTLRAFVLEGVPATDCMDAENPLDVHAFFDPPVAVDPEGEFDFGASLLIAVPFLRNVSVAGDFAEGGSASGVFDMGDVYPDICAVELVWTAQGPPPPTATPTSAATETPEPSATLEPPPTATAAVEALPAAGVAGGEGGASSAGPALALAAALAAAGTAAFAFARRRRRVG